MLIIFSGLPGTGKTTLAKAIAQHFGATYVRIDTIEQALRNSVLQIEDVEDAGYVIGYSIAKDNLAMGKDVVADSVNPLELTRSAWLSVALDANCRSIEIEVICSSKEEHQKRIETRSADIQGHQLPSWKKVMTRDYEPWNREHIIIDTANKTVTQCVRELLEYIEKK